MAGSAEGELVLLTGSSGCLGHQTLKLLISRDERTSEIRCLDRRAPSGEQRREIELLLEQNNQTGKTTKLVRYFQADLTDLSAIEGALSDMRVSCVIHCAAQVDIWLDRQQQDKRQLEEVNVGGTENLLKSCVRFGVSKFVHVSSFETFVSYHVIYYATENTIPEPDFLSFGASAQSKKLAESKVLQYANNKLRPHKRPARELNSSNDFLNAAIVRFAPIYGEYDRYFVSRYLRIAKFFSNTLQRFTNIWIRQQPIYVGNAAWALICAKNKMDTDHTISGEVFHVTDDTPIGDPFEFVQPFLECKGMRLSKSSYPGLPLWLLIWFFFWITNLLCSLDVFNLFTSNKSRLQEAIERDQRAEKSEQLVKSDDEWNMDGDERKEPTRWYHVITPETFFFGINSLFLNRTKASLRLNYEPIFDFKTSQTRALAWYRDKLKL